MEKETIIDNTNVASSYSGSVMMELKGTMRNRIRDGKQKQKEKKKKKFEKSVKYLVASTRKWYEGLNWMI